MFSPVSLWVASALVAWYGYGLARRRIPREGRPSRRPLDRAVGVVTIAIAHDITLRLFLFLNYETWRMHLCRDERCLLLVRRPDTTPDRHLGI